MLSENGEWKNDDDDNENDNDDREKRWRGEREFESRFNPARMLSKDID